MNNATSRLTLAVPVALLLIFIFLHFAFGSLKDAIMIFTSIPLATVGGVFLLWIRGMPFSVSAGVGFIALFGIATDDGVVMATYLTQTFDRNTPENRKEIRASIVEAGEKRIRPCLMTTATTILALLPVLTSTWAMMCLTVLRRFIVRFQIPLPELPRPLYVNEPPAISGGFEFGLKTD